jgi:secretion/DNA translocation related TadE-like protein
MKRDERGSASLLAVGVALLLLGAGLVGALWAAVSLGSHRATSAADLAALSAAQAVQSGARDPCASARRIAADQEVDLRECAIEGEIVSITVAVRLDLGAIGSPAVTAQARAGPLGTSLPT